MDTPARPRTERHQLFMPGGIALHAQESVFEAPAFEVRPELFVVGAGFRNQVIFADHLGGWWGALLPVAGMMLALPRLTASHDAVA